MPETIPPAEHVERVVLEKWHAAAPLPVHDRMAEAGLEKARGWMKFERDASSPKPAATGC